MEEKKKRKTVRTEEAMFGAALFKVGVDGGLRRPGSGE